MRCFVRIKDNICLKELESFRFRYQENLIFPTYRKVIYSGKRKVIIEILVKSRVIYINKDINIKNEYLRYIKDLKLAGFLCE